VSRLYTSTARGTSTAITIHASTGQPPPLTAAEHLGATVACGFVMALLVIALVSLSGTALGVSLSPGQWTGMIGLMLVGLVPLTVLGILLGHVSRAPR
jgi:hypothetical protein